MYYKTDIPQIAALRSKVEETAGFRMTTHSDFLMLVMKIEQQLREHISEITLERLWNYSTRKSETTTERSLNVLAQYIGCNDWADFCECLRRENKIESGFFHAESVLTKDLITGTHLRLSWQPDREIEIEYLGENRFVTIESKNSSISSGDAFSCLLFQKNRPLYMDMFQRCGEETQSAANSRYVVGQDNGLTSIEIL